MPYRAFWFGTKNKPHSSPCACGFLLSPTGLRLLDRREDKEELAKTHRKLIVPGRRLTQRRLRRKKDDEQFTP